jgi:hypothetical protein
MDLGMLAGLMGGWMGTFTSGFWRRTFNYFGKDAGDVSFQQDNDSKHICKKAQT